MKQRISHIFLALAMVLGSLIPAPVRAEETAAYFVGVNDVLLTMQASSQPIWVDRYICLPYTVFHSSSTGSSLGLSSSYQRSSGLVTISDSQNSLIFNLATGTCTDSRSQQVYHSQAVLRDGIPYVPMTTICDYFQLKYSYHNISYGYLVRISNNNASLTESQFIQNHSNTMELMLKAFRQGSVYGAVTETPETPIFLGFTLGESLDFTDTLREWNINAVFFFQLDQLMSHGDYLRKLYGSGHSIGFYLQEDSLDAQQEELALCQELLRAQTQSTSQILLLQKNFDQFKEEGFVLWQGGTGSELTEPSTVVRSLKQGTNSIYLTFTQSDSTLENWSQLMNLLEEKNFVPQIPVESKL
ncbi:MAG: hypothetical protein R3Y63_08315 [Eubacteriales bacterium]